MDFEPSAKAQDYARRVRAFIDEIGRDLRRQFA